MATTLSDIEELQKDIKTIKDLLAEIKKIGGEMPLLEKALNS